MAQECRHDARRVADWTILLNEVPEHMAQESSHSPLRLLVQVVLNEVPEHMAQEFVKFAKRVDFILQSSMKFLSTWLRNFLVAVDGRAAFEVSSMKFLSTWLRNVRVRRRNRYVGIPQ